MAWVQFKHVLGLFAKGGYSSKAFYISRRNMLLSILYNLLELKPVGQRKTT